MFYYFFSFFSHPDKNVYKYYIYVNPTLSILFHFSIPIIFLYTDKNMYKYILISFYFLSFFYDLFSLSRQYNKYAQIYSLSMFYHFSMLFFLFQVLGVDTAFCSVESLITGIVDNWSEQLLPHRKKVAAVICGTCFFLGLPMCTEVSIYLNELKEPEICNVFYRVGSSMTQYFHKYIPIF